MPRSPFGFFVFCLVICFSLAQNASVKAVNRDSLRMEELDEAIPVYIRSNPDTVLLFLREQMRLLGEGDLSEAAVEDLRPRVLNNHGVYYRIRSNLDSSLHYYQLASEAQDSARNPARKATLFNNIANVHFQQGDYPLSLDHHFRALSIRRTIDDSAGLCMSFGNIGLVYENLDEPNKALKYYKESLVLGEALKNTRQTAWVYTSLGTLALSEGKLDASESYLRESLILKRELSDLRGVGFSLTNLGAVFLKRFHETKDASWLDSTHLYLREAEELEASQGNDFALAATLNYRGEAWLASGNPNRALDFLKRADTLTEIQQHLQERVRTLNLLSQCYEQLGRLDLALQSERAFKALSDTLFNVERDKEIGRKEAWIRYKQQLREDQLRFDNELALEEAGRERMNLIIAVIGLSLLLALGLVFRLYAQRREAREARAMAEAEVGNLSEEKRQIEEKNRELQARITGIQEKLESKKEELPEHLEKLTKREMEVLLSLGLGLTDKEIAERLFISIATVRTHNRRIFEKLDISNRTEAVNMIHRYKLV